MSSSPLRRESSQEAQSSPLKAFPQQSSAHHHKVQPVVPPHAAGMDSRQLSTTKEPEIELFVKVGLRREGGQ